MVNILADFILVILVYVNVTFIFSKVENTTNRSLCHAFSLYVIIGITMYAFKLKIKFPNKQAVYTSLSTAGENTFESVMGSQGDPGRGAEDGASGPAHSCKARNG